MNIDNRILRTKHDLRNALIHLLLVNDFNSINVKLICDSALVHKQTFYKHYKDKYDLFNDVVNSLIKLAISDIKGNNPTEYFTKIFTNIINVSVIYKGFILSLAKNELLVEIIHNALVNYAKALLKSFNNNRVLKYNINYTASGIAGALEYIIYDFLADNPEKNKESLINEVTNFLTSIINNNILFDDKIKSLPN